MKWDAEERRLEIRAVIGGPENAAPPPQLREEVRGSEEEESQ